MKTFISAICASIFSVLMLASCYNGPDVAGKSYTAPKALLGTDITYSFTDKEYTLEAMGMVLEEGTYRVQGDSVFIKANDAAAKEEILNYREDKLIDKEGLVLVNAVTLKKNTETTAPESDISNN